MKKKLTVVSSILLFFIVIANYQVVFVTESSYFREEQNNNDLEDLSLPKSSHNPIWYYRITTSETIQTVAISSDGNYFVTGTGPSTSGKVYLFNSTTSKLIWSYTPTITNVYSVAISSNGSYIAASNRYVYLLNKSSSNPMWISEDLGGAVKSVAISSDGYYIAAAVALDTLQGRVYFYNKTSSTPMWSYLLGTGFRYLDISSSGDYILACTSTDLVLFDKSGSLKRIYSSGGEIYSIDISADGNHILAGFANNKVRLYDNSNDNPYLTYDSGTSGYIRSVSISFDGSYFSVGNTESKIFLFNNTSSIPIRTFIGGYLVTISSSGNYTAAIRLDALTILIRQSSSPLWSYSLSNEHYGYVPHIAISSNGTYIILGRSNYIYLFHRDRSGPAETIPLDEDDDDADEKIEINPVLAGIIALIVLGVIGGVVGTYLYLPTYKKQKQKKARAKERIRAKKKEAEVLLNKIDDSINSGETLLSQGKYSQSIEKFNSALENANKNRNIISIKKINDIQSRLKLAQDKLFEENQNKIESLINEGKQYENIDKFKSAIKNYFKALKIMYEQPESVDQIEKIRELELKITEVSLQQVENLLNEGNSLKNQMKFDNSVKTYNQALNSTKNILDSEKREEQVSKIKNLIDSAYSAKIAGKTDKAKQLREQNQRTESILAFEEGLSIISKIKDPKLKSRHKRVINRYINEVKIDIIKSTILDLGTKFVHLQLNEIVEECEEDENLVLRAVKKMIQNNEIYAKYFESSRAVAFNKEANIENIDKLKENLIFEKDVMLDFIDVLERKFAEWEKAEKNKTKKL